MRIIVVGAGVVGSHIASRLAAERHDVTVIERDEDRIAELEDTIDAMLIPGNGASPEVLKSAGVEKADIVVAVTESDEINIVSCLVAGLLNPGCVTIARARDPDFERNREIFSREPLRLSLFINPEVEACERILRLLRIPVAEDIMEFAEGAVQLCALKVDTRSRLAHTRLADLPTIGHRVLVAGIRRKDRWIIPRGEDTILPGDLVYLSSPTDRVQDVVTAIGLQWRETRQVMIFGGGEMALYLARRLEQQGVAVRIIEEDRERCELLASTLSKTVVLNGTATDERLLREENVGRVDAFVALADDEEDNIIAALLAKSLGAPLTVISTGKPSYGTLVRAIGVDRAVTPQLEAAGAILRFIRKGQVSQVAAIREGGAEAISFRVTQGCGLVGLALREVAFPRDSLVMAIVREGNVIVPDGSTVMEAGDKVLVFATREALPRLEMMFAARVDEGNDGSTP